ncbi:hypothetical protein M501DRAFT_997789 [Patellaria atrata CBS 101060]|uniref:Uncharacterized protein n=1 Tax=Patellaria atrata CBS 101060 TaxID=1346257 RepID=A0A9P4VNF6_9PEZI|nr:hypothetical protein M501DRAFT_997789 [Patellaria atrata CBS 101060]
MSSSIAIPQRKKNNPISFHNSASSSSSPSSYSPSSSYSPKTTEVSSSIASPSSSSRYRNRRPSLLGSSLSKSEHIVINVGSEDAPRLVTCVKSSQGFDWNQEIFLPSYADHHFSDLERKQDPVYDIILTDEEAASILPQ